MELGTITMAAERLRISQPAVSKIIAGLEWEIGYPLFERIKGRLAPTGEARLLAVEADRLYYGLDALTTYAREIQQRQVGELTVYSTPAFGRSLLPMVIADFVAEHSRARLVTHVRSSIVVNQRAVDQRLDLGFSMMPFDHPSVTIEDLCHVPAVCALPKGHRLRRRSVVRPADLEGESFLSFPLDGRMRHLIDAVFEQQSVRRTLRIDVYSSAEACALVARGLGVAIVDPFTGRDYRREGIVILPFEPRILYTFRVIRPKFRERSRLADAFMDGVRGELAKLA